MSLLIQTTWILIVFGNLSPRTAYGASDEQYVIFSSPNISQRSSRSLATPIAKELAIQITCIPQPIPGKHSLLSGWQN